MKKYFFNSLLILLTLFSLVFVSYSWFSLNTTVSSLIINTGDMSISISIFQKEDNGEYSSINQVTLPTYQVEKNTLSIYKVIIKNTSNTNGDGFYKLNFEKNQVPKISTINDKEIINNEFSGLIQYMYAFNEEEISNNNNFTTISFDNSSKQPILESADKIKTGQTIIYYFAFRYNEDGILNYLKENSNSGIDSQAILDIALVCEIAQNEDYWEHE